MNCGISELHAMFFNAVPSAPTSLSGFTAAPRALVFSVISMSSQLKTQKASDLLPKS